MHVMQTVGSDCSPADVGFVLIAEGVVWPLWCLTGILECGSCGRGTKTSASVAGESRRAHVGAAGKRCRYTEAEMRLKLL